MANVCIICFKFEERNNQSQNNVELQRKYFKFVERYLSGGGGCDDGSGYQLTNFLFEQALNSGMVCCGKCHEGMEAFCDLYNQLKIIELRLNWEVERLKNNLEFGGEAGLVKGLNVDGNYWANEDEMLELIRDLRRSIIDKCNRTLSRSLPKVAVSKYGLKNYFTGSPPTTIANVIDEPQQEVNVNEDDQVFAEMDYEEEASSVCSKSGEEEDESEKIPEPTHMNPIIKVEINRVNEKTTSDPIDIDPNPSLGEPEMQQHHLSNHEENPSSSIFDNVANPVDLPASSEDIPTSSTDSDSEYSDFLNTSDSESDDNDDPEVDQDEPDVKPVIKKETSQSETRSSRFKQYRFKCPGCSNLYKHLHELLFHHNKSHKNSDEVNETLLVDIFWISRQLLPWRFNRLPVLNLATIPPDALHHTATFETPTQIYFCKHSSCKEQPLYSEKALDDHAKLHGKFKCNFCPITKEFAPDLSLHEITKHNKKKTKGFCCSRCDYKNLLCKEGVINHHLTVHSSLPPFYTQGHCTVCKVNSNSFRPPYFLFEHCIKLHSTIISKIERRKIESTKEKKERQGKYFTFKCPSCPNLYRYLHELLLHHMEDHNIPEQEASQTLLVGICWIFYQHLPSLTEAPSVLNSEDFPADKLHHDAFIRAPSQVYFCNEKSCKEQPMYTEEALQGHAKLHGDFNCSFCSVTKEFAPDLALHEISEHGKDKSGKRHHCPRCDYSNKCQWQGESVVNHYLKEHLSLRPFYTQGFCAICNLQEIESQYKSSAVLFKHYRNRHNCNFNVADQKKVQFTCSLCNQEFNTSTEQQSHRRHNHRGESRLIPCSNEECRYLFETNEELESHVSLHEDSRNDQVAQGRKPMNYSFKCPDCNKLFPEIPNLILHHQKNHRGTDSTYITVDIFSYPYKSIPLTLEDTDEEAAFRIEVPRIVFVCSAQSCKKAFYSEDGLEQHKKLHGKFNCNFCKKSMTFAVDLALHEVELHGKIGKDGIKVGSRVKAKTRECPRCKVTFPGLKPYIEHHVGTHLSLTIADHDCPICKITNFTEGYFRKSRVKRQCFDHLNNYHDIKSLSPEAIQRCSVAGCGAYFTEGYQLSSHLQLKHNFDEKEKKEVKKEGFKCAICGKGLSGSYQLQIHLRKIHKHDPKLFRCTQDKDCPNLFGTKKELDRHIRNKHAEGMKFFAKVNCPTCHQLFNKNSLSSHMKVHQNEGSKVARPFVCEECGKCFRDKCRLQQHNLTHTGPESWPFTCETCGKKSRHKARHEEHLRTHSKDKPFVCQVCGVAYAHRHNLRIHVNSKHSDVMQDIPKKMDKTNINRKSEDGIYHVNKQRRIVTETDSE